MGIDRKKFNKRFKNKIIICKNCGTHIIRGKSNIQMTKGELRTFFAIEKLREKHPDWNDKKCLEHLKIMSLCSSFSKELNRQRKNINENTTI